MSNDSPVISSPSETKYFFPNIASEKQNSSVKYV